MSYKNWSSERQQAYWRRIQKIKVAHPDHFYPSEYHNMLRDVSNVAMDSMWRFYEHVERVAWPFSLWDGVPSAISKMAGASLRHSAALGDKADCERLYNTLNANVNAKDCQGNTALLKAVERKRLGVAEWLLDRGAKILPNKNGWDPVLWATDNGCIPALNMFHHHGVDMNHPRSSWIWKKGIPTKIVVHPIVVAACSKHPNAPKTVQWLLDHGASIDLPIYKGRTLRDLLNSDLINNRAREVLAKKAGKTPAPKRLRTQSFMQRIRAVIRH